MSNPYTQPSISGYNSSPPPDDGSTTSANQINWQTHLDKIGAPLKTYAEAIDANVLAAFAASFGAAGGVTAKTGAYTVATGDRGTTLSVTNATTITLLAAATAGDGFTVGVLDAGNDSVTIDGNASETINGDTTLVLRPQQFALLVCDGSNWRALVGLRPSTATTQATTSGRDVTFSGIPSWVTKITLTVIGVSSDGGTDALYVRLGDAGGVESTGYSNVVTNTDGSTVTSSTTSFQVIAGNNAAIAWHGAITLTRHGSTGLTWACTGQLAAPGTPVIHRNSGSKTLSAQLDRVTFGLLGSTDSFDAGAVGLWYE